MVQSRYAVLFDGWQPPPLKPLTDERSLELPIEADIPLDGIQRTGEPITQQSATTLALPRQVLPQNE